MEIIDRILMIWEDLDISRSKFERSINKSSGYLNNTKRQGNQVGVDTILKIADIYPQYSLDWILFGTGEMKISGENSKKHQRITPGGQNFVAKEINQRLDDIEKGLGLLLLRSELVDATRINSAIDRLFAFLDSK